LLEQTGMLAAALLGQSLLKLAGPVDDSRQATGADVQESPDPGEEEDRRYRQLDGERDLCGAWGEIRKHFRFYRP
jgi:hypothetical protein